MDMRMVVGLNVQRVRREKGFSQEELSFRSGFSRAYLSGLEAGKRNPTIMSLWKLAVALDVTLEELIQRPSKLDAKKQDGARTSRSRAKIET
nr:helix-turn-helix transcriptional regulator [Chelatococcus sambhunathii]